MLVSSHLCLHPPKYFYHSGFLDSSIVISFIMSACYVACLSHTSWCNDHNNVCLRVRIMEHLVQLFSMILLLPLSQVQQLLSWPSSHIHTSILCSPNKIQVNILLTLNAHENEFYFTGIVTFLNKEFDQEWNIL